jgi:glutamate 5-kinase
MTMVVKLGSSIVAAEGGELRSDVLDGVCAQVADLEGRGERVVMVTSGAIARGRRLLGLQERPRAMDELQAASAVGQGDLFRAYETRLAEAGVRSAQVLLTASDIAARTNYLNARQTLRRLLEWGVVPVVNENDTVATSEIRYGDNDRLAARVASMMSADCLVLLSDVDGFYTAPPWSAPDAKRLDEVRDITPEIEAMAGDVGSELSRGGMVTKIEAAKIAVAGGTHMAIASGKVLNPLQALAGPGGCTWFLAHSDPVAARKRWIAGTLEPRGAVIVDRGAADALTRGKSLLPAGVTKIEGSFERGDAVVIRNGEGAELGRGLAAYDHEDAKRIIGRKSSELPEILGYRGDPELIHRDDMVLHRRG